MRGWIDSSENAIVPWRKPPPPTCPSLFLNNHMIKDRVAHQGFKATTQFMLLFQNERNISKIKIDTSKPRKKAMMLIWMYYLYNLTKKLKFPAAVFSFCFNRRVLDDVEWFCVLLGVFCSDLYSPVIKYNYQNTETGKFTIRKHWPPYFIEHENQNATRARAEDRATTPHWMQCNP